jgi:hypothetical protein
MKHNCQYTCLMLTYMPPGLCALFLRLGTIFVYNTGHGDWSWYIDQPNCKIASNSIQWLGLYLFIHGSWEHRPLNLPLKLNWWMSAEQTANWLASLFPVCVLPRLPPAYCSALLRATVSCHWQSWIYIKVTNCSEEERGLHYWRAVIVFRVGSVSGGAGDKGRAGDIDWQTCCGYTWDTQTVSHCTKLQSAWWLTVSLSCCPEALCGGLPTLKGQWYRVTVG